MIIEQEFFEAFGIEPTIIITILSCKECKYKSSRNCPDKDDIAECPEVIEKNYPPITPEIVLGLERIIAQYFEEEGGYQFLVITSDGYSVGNIINGKHPIFDDYVSLLKLCIDHQDKIQDQVKALFKC